VFDRRRMAGEDSGPHLRAVRPADLEPTPQQLSDGALHVVSLVSTGVAVDATAHDATVAVYGTEDGVWAHWVDPDDQRRHVAARMGAPDLFVLATDVIAGRAPAG